MARSGIVFGLLLCGLSFVAMVVAPDKAPSQFLPIMLGVPVLFCGVVALNPHRRKYAMHAAGSIAFLGTIVGAGRVLFCLLGLAGDGYNSHSFFVLAAMTLVSALFFAICLGSLVAARRRNDRSSLLRKTATVSRPASASKPSVHKKPTRESA